MKKIFEIPIYALSPSELSKRVQEHINKLPTGLDASLFAHSVDAGTFPMRSWDYNHIVGYIRISVSAADVVFDIFLSLPSSKRYFWTTTKKTHVQNIFANGTHIYLGEKKTNCEVRKSITNMLNQVISDHIPSRFYVDREAFDVLNQHLDYLGIIESEKTKAEHRERLNKGAPDATAAQDYKTASYIAYLLACDFLSVAKELEQAEDFKLIPTVINASFSCELFLKALLIWQRQSTIPIKKHSLAELFCLLDREDQVAIRNRADIFEWSCFMEEASNAFEKWRYRHEKNGLLMISIGDLLRFSEALKTCCEVKYFIKE